ncbi:penicillin-binding transpeptidase domain-containing protein [Streptomyces sp. NBC_00536]|nr:NTF2-like N-terminal transpeptidase domain-containing protein [Streptomyces sp. NBC_00536]WUC76917.1 penicillin-binding transpeptidase domain-containing protein [Streptomyces sp. NBC_00536]
MDWAGGRAESAGARTTTPDQAQSVLRNFTSGLGIVKPTLTVGAASPAKDGAVTVAFSARMPVPGLGTWSYDSRIPVRRQEDGAPAKVVTQLRALMRATVTEGTARGLAGLPGHVGAKTGTAEVSESAPNNGWVVATRGNVAVAVVVEGRFTDGSSAVPVVRHLLEAVPADPS